MSTIKESIDTLSEKLGVTEREQTIKDQLDLCVERLGGTGCSKDIAESAEKFAEKEDGTATFMAKTVTENETYNAADDGVSGYSSVTVNVPAPVLIEKNVTANDTYVAADDSADGYSSVTVNVPVGLDVPTLFNTRKTQKTGPTTPTAFVDSSIEVCLVFTDINGVAEIFDRYSNPEQTFSTILKNQIIIGDVKKIDATIDTASTVTFKAATDFEGIYINDTKITETGDEIISGNWYTVILERNAGTTTATVSGDSDYTEVITIE